jgi:AraC-like DNA-binding protein
VETLVALLTRERDQRAVRAAVSGTLDVHCVTHCADLRQAWTEGMPAALLAELADADGAASARALVAFHRRAPLVPVCLYIPWETEAVRQAVQLAIDGVVTDVMIAGSNDLPQRLASVLRQARVRSEMAALRSVWRPWTPPPVRTIVAACIAASDRPVSVAEVAHRSNWSIRTLERQLAQVGLPPAQRILGWCRLLRAAYRLDRRRATVKVVAAELGYSSPHAFVQHLHRHAGLTSTDLRRRGGFAALAACARSELVTRHDHALLHVRARRGGRRVGK